MCIRDRGKGIIAASLAKLLQSRGLTVTIQKFDPYLNIDPGTLNPYEHGECYVTDDGAETDLDLGHYERFLNIPTSQANNVTTGRIYQTVINKERELSLIHISLRPSARYCGLRQDWLPQRWVHIRIAQELLRCAWCVRLSLIHI